MALSGLNHIVFCICRNSDMGIIAEFRINNKTVPEQFRERRFAFGKILTWSAKKQCSPDNAYRTPSRNAEHCYNFDPITTVTIVIRLDKRLRFLVFYWTHQTAGVISRPLRTIPNLLRTYSTVQTMIGHSRLFMIVSRFFYFSCLSD